MGNMCCADSRAPTRTVTYLPNSLPKDNPKYQMVTNNSLRFSEVSVNKQDRNEYLFTMSMKNEPDLHVKIPVLNEIVHCVTNENYGVEIGSSAIVDLFCQEYTSGMLEVRNPKTGMEFSMRVLPFRSYTSMEFKKALHEVWLNLQLGTRSNRTVRLMDYFVYGLNLETQAFVLLFERCTTSLANVAEYRKQANMPWNNKQKIKIVTQVLQSYQTLVDKRIVHRDLRPSNVFYCPSSGSFCIGSFTHSRLMRKAHAKGTQGEQDNGSDDLMTVCGVPDSSCNQMEALMFNGQSIGYYSGQEQDYEGLKAIVRLIQTCELLDRNPECRTAEVSMMLRALSERKDFKEIVEKCKGVGAKNSVEAEAEIGDREVGESCSFLLAHTHRERIEEWVFESYGLLGYHKEYSDKAHKMLERNNENEQELDNAPILEKLGQFYQSKGSKGTEYFYNAFVLYVSRFERQLKRQFEDRAEEELDHARNTFLKFHRDLQSELPRLEIDRMTALLEDRRQRKQAAIKLIDQTFIKAGQENIPIEKQCRILLAFAEIHRNDPATHHEALDKLTIGLTICENGVSFESPSSCRAYRGHFLFRIGALHLDEMLTRYSPKRNSEEQSYGSELKGKVEANLMSALDLYEKEAVDEIDVALCLQELATFYYHDESFHEAQKYLERALMRHRHLKGPANPLTVVKLLYLKGSSHYYLKEYESAARQYESALGQCDRLDKKEHNLLLRYNIQGNLGLTLIHMKRSEGKAQFEAALENIRLYEGEKSYDYLCLKMAYNKLRKRN